MRLSALTWCVLVGCGLSACSDGGSPVLLPPADARGDAEREPADASLDAAPDRGTRRAYVVSGLGVPTSEGHAMAVGLDLDPEADDGVDNQFGLLIARLRASASDLDVASGTGPAVRRGEVIILVDLYFDRDSSAAAAPPSGSGPARILNRRRVQALTTTSAAVTSTVTVSLLARARPVGLFPVGSRIGGSSAGSAHSPCRWHCPTARSRPCRSNAPRRS